MSETHSQANHEISPEQQKLFEDRAMELLPPLTPRAHPATERALEIMQAGELSEEALVWMEAEAEHDLEGKIIALSYAETAGHSELKVVVSEETIRTEESVGVGYYSAFRIMDKEPSFRHMVHIFKRSNFTDLTELKKMFTPEYLQPVIDEYDRLSAESYGPAARTFTVARFHSLLALLDRLGPDTLRRPAN